MSRVLSSSRAPAGSRLARASLEAIATMVATIATLLCVLAISREPSPAILAVVLCLSLSRSQLDRDRRGLIEAAFVLPAVGLAAAGVGILLHHFPIAGALVFTAGMFVSIWLRRFGPTARRIGSLIALPFVTLLTVPYIPPTQPRPVPALLLPIIVGWLALFWVHLVHALMHALHPLPPVHRAPAVPTPTAESSLRPIASTRMAIQMAVALSLSFAVGYVAFPQHWSWIVLTAFIVNSGNRGRLDVVHKSILRVLGAAMGTLVALLLGVHLGLDARSIVLLILAAVFLGIWLRPFGYGWWALFVTVALALLQDWMSVPAARMLWPRLEEIVVGAIIGMAAAWFVLPIRSTDVLRRRIADALAALSGALDRQPENPDAFVAALHAVEQIAPAFRATRHIAHRVRPERPAEWIEVLLDYREPAAKLIEQGHAPPNVQRALAHARRSIREPAQILPALQQLRMCLREAASSCFDFAE
jgi:hypothetical protein